MRQQPYDFGQSDPDHSNTAAESPQYGYEPRRSYYDFTTIQPGRKRRKKRVSIRRVISTVLAIVGGCLFALPFLQVFGVFHFLGLGPEKMTPEHFNRTFSFMTTAFIGFALMAVSTFIRGKGK